MTINNNYNFGLLSDDGTTSNPTSLQNLKSFTLNYDSVTGLWSVQTNNLTDYFIEYYNKIQASNGPGATEFSGLVIYNKKGKNFVILLQNMLQQYLTSANYVIFTGPGTLPTLNNMSNLFKITYPEIPTFINGYNGYNIDKSIFNGATFNNLGTVTFYILD